MSPFQDCLGCHSSSGSAHHVWTVAGTWAKGATITVVDPNGKTVTMRGNEVGNFYTAETLAFPLTVYVNGRVMTSMTDHVTPQLITYGGCNLCHRADALTVGPLMAPGFDCLTCHGPAGMASAKFSSAGTWGASAGSTVSVGGATTQTNAAGNFIFCASGNPCTWYGSSYGTVAPITSWPAPASVSGSVMQGGAPYGGCNACHGRGGSAENGN
jgi:hypothetical protein